MADGRALFRRIPGAQKVLARGRRRSGDGHVMYYAPSDRIEIGWVPLDVDSGGAVCIHYTRDQALQLVDEVLDLLDVEQSAHAMSRVPSEENR